MQPHTNQHRKPLSNLNMPRAGESIEEWAIESVVIEPNKEFLPETVIESGDSFVVGFQENLIESKKRAKKERARKREAKRARGECVKCPNNGCEATYMSKNAHYYKHVKSCKLSEVN